MLRLARHLCVRVILVLYMWSNWQLLRIILPSTIVNGGDLSTLWNFEEFLVFVGPQTYSEYPITSMKSKENSKEMMFPGVCQVASDSRSSKTK